MKKIVAYLQIYNDSEFLKDSLESVRDLIDEVVIVDGAYSWLANYYETIGFNPSKSNEVIYDILSDTGLKYKVIDGIWDNQISKRMAGYDACDGEYVMRIDSDEIIDINANSLNNFINSSSFICSMEMPTYLSENLIYKDIGMINFFWNIFSTMSGFAIGILLFKEKVNHLQWIGISLSLLGIGLVILNDYQQN
jgi:glycosyltransferase involved in cell wall biosynthesis